MKLIERRRSEHLELVNVHEKATVETDLKLLPKSLKISYINTVIIDLLKG